MKVSKYNYSDFPPRTGETLKEMLKPTTPNLYLTPEASTTFLAHPPSTPPKTYELGMLVKLNAAKVPTILLDPRFKLITKSAGYIADFGSKAIEHSYPTTAESLQTMSIIVGGYGCIERLLKPEKYSRWRLWFSLLDFILSVLSFLGKYVPQIQGISLWFLGAKAIVKIGDEIAEYNLSPQEKRELLKGIQSSSRLSPE